MQNVQVLQLEKELRIVIQAILRNNWWDKENQYVWDMYQWKQY